jgi:hypothetical protein
MNIYMITEKDMDIDTCTDMDLDTDTDTDWTQTVGTRGSQNSLQYMYSKRGVKPLHCVNGRKSILTVLLNMESFDSLGHS